MVEGLIYDTYFEDTRLLTLTESLATIAVNNFIQKQVLSSYITVLTSTLNEVTDRNYLCQLVLLSDVEKLHEHDSLSFGPEVFKKNTQTLNSDYTFESFIVGQSNKEPHAAALAASSAPGKFYNPLFIYGDSGLGKTHLLHSIGNFVTNKFEEYNTLIITAADFVDGVYKSQKNLDEFKQQLVGVDVFLVDEIQFLADKKKSEEIFFHVFNELVNKKKQIVLTSDHPPHEIRGLEDRLVSRFASGLAVSITAPEFETAVRIIKSKIEKQGRGLDIDDGVIDYIAVNYSSDVRKIEGALNRLIFNLIQNPDKEKIDLPFAISVLKETIASNSEMTVKVIKEAVKDFYGLSKGQLEGKTRTSNITMGRHIAMYLCRKYLDLPFKEIGEHFGKRDHSTIMSACDKVEKLIKSDNNYKNAISKIEEYFIHNN